MKLRLAAKEKIHEIQRLKEEVRNNEDIFLNIDTEISKYYSVRIKTKKIRNISYTN